MNNGTGFPGRAELHDLKQPLNVIQLTCGTLRAKRAAGAALDEADLIAKLERIEAQASKAGQMIDALLARLPQISD